jgi:CDP-6-deoxy-D-xylo-4-hexulose-3-dehydrase
VQTRFRTETEKFLNDWYSRIMRIPLASSGLRQQDINAAIQVLESGNLTMGVQVKEFERKMAKYLGTKHFIMVNSGSSANLLMIEALLRPSKSRSRLSPGDSILVPAIAWPTTIWPLIQLGLNPVFIDVDPDTLAIDLLRAQDLIDQSGIPIHGIFPIHPLGYAIPPSRLEEFCEHNELILINDVCESLGSWSEGKHAGTSGIAGSFSFYFSHHITTMEGGGIATNEDDLADDLKSMRSHGWSRDRSDSATWNERKSANDAKFLFVSTGYNVRPMEIQAAIGSLQIDSIDEFVSRRRFIAESVCKALTGTGLSVIGSNSISNPSTEKNNSWMLIPIKVTGPNAGLRKTEILKKLEVLEIETRPVLTGNFLAQPALQRITKNAANPTSFQVATEITDSAFLVGAHHDLTKSQIDFLCESLKSVSAI